MLSRIHYIRIKIATSFAHVFFLPNQLYYALVWWFTLFSKFFFDLLFSSHYLVVPSFLILFFSLPPHNYFSYQLLLQYFTTLFILFALALAHHPSHTLFDDMLHILYLFITHTCCNLSLLYHLVQIPLYILFLFFELMRWMAKIISFLLLFCFMDKWVLRLCTVANGNIFSF